MNTQTDTTAAFDPETLRLFDRLFDEYKEDALWYMADLAKKKFADKAVNKFEDWLKKQKRIDNDLMAGFRRLCKPASMMSDDPSPPEQVWFGIYRGAVTYLAGETGAGKSSALYNIAVHAAQNKPLWGVEFGLKRPLSVLYLDPENARLQSAWKIKNIGQGKPENLIIHPATGVDLSETVWQEALRQVIHEDKHDLVLLDPLVNLFNTVNENDNPEGARQMQFLQSLAQETRAAILVVHHMGKGGENSSPNYGRGASSRLASADVGLLWRSRSEGDSRDDTYRPDEKSVERNDECRLKMSKNRLGPENSLYLKMAGRDRFEVSSHAAWRGKAENADKKSQMEMAIQAITDSLIGGGCKSRTDILAILKDEGIGETNADKALKQMCADGNLERRTHGKNGLEYVWAQSVTQTQAA